MPRGEKNQICKTFKKTTNSVFPSCSQHFKKEKANKCYFIVPGEKNSKEGKFCLNESKGYLDMMVSICLALMQLTLFI